MEAEKSLSQGAEVTRADPPALLPAVALQQAHTEFCITVSTENQDMGTGMDLNGPVFVCLWDCLMQQVGTSILGPPLPSPPTAPAPAPPLLPRPVLCAHLGRDRQGGGLDLGIAP